MIKVYEDANGAKYVKLETTPDDHPIYLKIVEPMGTPVTCVPTPAYEIQNPPVTYDENSTRYGNVRICLSRIRQLINDGRKLAELKRLLKE